MRALNNTLISFSAILFSVTTFASNGPYIETNIGWGKTKIVEQRYQGSSTQKITNKGISLNLTTGYMFSDYIGIETGISRTADIKKLDAGQVGQKGTLTNNFSIPFTLVFQYKIYDLIPYFNISAVLGHTTLKGPGPYSTMGGRNYNIGNYYRFSLGLASGVNYQLFENIYTGVGISYIRKNNPIPEKMSIYGTLGYNF